VTERDSRRAFLATSGASLLLAACSKEERKEERAETNRSAASPSAPTTSAPSGPSGATGDEGRSVSATEDLMREHGVIRRVLVAYREAAARLRTRPGDVAHFDLLKAARLVRTFAEDYHEKQLEEAHVFPALQGDGGPLAAMVDTLVAQHRSGRAITDYVLAVTVRPIAAPVVEPLARALEAFARMYEAHAALEDTVVFPAWKKVLTPSQLAAMGDRFEDIEHETFGKDGFEDAVDQVGGIEKSLGIELSALTAPPPAR
jgi:hemerythrin-like domain-containing protein